VSRAEIDLMKLSQEFVVMRVWVKRRREWWIRTKVVLLLLRVMNWIAPFEVSDECCETCGYNELAGSNQSSCYYWSMYVPLRARGEITCSKWMGYEMQ